MTKHENSNKDQTQKHELWQHSNFQILIKIQQQQDSKTEFATKLKNSNCD